MWECLFSIIQFNYFIILIFKIKKLRKKINTGDTLTIKEKVYQWMEKPAEKRHSTIKKLL